MSSSPRSLLKPIGAALMVLALVAIAVVIVTQRDTSSGPGGEFVTRDGGQLMLDGEVFAYAGTNNYELMYQGQPPVDAFMKTAADAEMTVIRTWAFFDVGTPSGDDGLNVEISNKGTYFQYFDIEQGRPAYNDGADGLERLDYVIYSAKQHDLKLVLPLVNNWTAFGGVDQYVRWADGEYHDDFLTDETIKQWYKDWVEHLLERENIFTGVKYKDEPAIMAWEIANELRCSDSGPYPSSENCNPETMLAWAEEMSDHVRSIDSNHLIGFGGEGFLCTEPGGDYWLTNCGEAGDPAAILALPNIDLHGIHVYPNHWTPTEPTDDWADFGDWWIEEHGALADEYDKPFYIGEYGWLDKPTRLPLFNRWLETFHEAGGDGSHFWIMQPASSIGQEPDAHGFTEKCPSAVCTVVTNWSLVMRDGADWNDFGPVASTNVTSTMIDVPTTLNIVDNDMAFGDATLDLTSIDLDPETDGVQAEKTAKGGTFTVAADGSIEFVPAEGFYGSTRVDYTISDSEGRASNVSRISAVVLKSTEE